MLVYSLTVAHVDVVLVDHELELEHSIFSDLRHSRNCNLAGCQMSISCQVVTITAQDYQRKRVSVDVVIY